MMTNDLNLALDSLSGPEICGPLLDRLRAELDFPLRFMEVCGTHTVSIFRSGLRGLLPPQVTHISGPGCPVCVTHDREIAAALDLAGKDGVLVATFGDLMRVPGPGGLSLKNAQAAGARVEVVYSPMNALQLAEKHRGERVVFLGAGFETTAPAVAAAIQIAAGSGLSNFLVLSFHKLVPPALRALLAREDGKDSAGAGIDAFLLPGHVSTIIGLEPYAFVAEEFHRPGVVGGFEPADILQVLLLMAAQKKSGRAAIENQYARAVSYSGNPKARLVMDAVFRPADALWRGLGVLPASGLEIRETYAAHDAKEHFDLTWPEAPEAPEASGCSCGKVLRGRISPEQCPLFGRACTPATPVGPCMVSTEGSCAAHFKYGLAGGGRVF